MPNRKWTYGILISLLALVLISANIIRSFQKQELKVIFLNVGQGDSILISKGTNQILIDGGPSGTTLLSEAGKYIPFWDRKIELIIETHPDQDHIQGLVDVFKHYQVKKVVQTKNESQSQVFKTLQDLIEKEKIEVINGTGGVSLKLAGEIQGDIIYPSDIKTGKDTNENSVVLKLKTEKSSFLFTGDLPTSSEAEIISKGIDINADYLKVAHHGSKYATSAEFLEKVKPKEAIISVGKNSYGHPSQEALDRLKKENIPVLRTDEEGDIIFICPREERCYRQI